MSLLPAGDDPAKHRSTGGLESCIESAWTRAAQCPLTCSSVATKKLKCCEGAGSACSKLRATAAHCRRTEVGKRNFISRGGSFCAYSDIEARLHRECERTQGDASEAQEAQLARYGCTTYVIVAYCGQECVRTMDPPSHNKVTALNERASCTLAEAAHYLRLRVATLRSWGLGRQYTTAGGGSEVPCAHSASIAAALFTMLIDREDSIAPLHHSVMVKHWKVFTPGQDVSQPRYLLDEAPMKPATTVPTHPGSRIATVRGAHSNRYHCRDTFERGATVQIHIRDPIRVHEPSRHAYPKT